MTPLLWTLGIGAALLAFALAARWVLRASVRGGDIESALAIRAMQLYARAWHALRTEGLEHIPDRVGPEGLIVIANHTAGVDPLLIQAVCPFEIRWMMAQDMQVESLGWLWKFAKVISVDRASGATRMGLKTAADHVRQGEAVGIFPEGHLERPPRMLLPFQPGLGVLVRRTGAPVMQIVIDGTPQVDPAWASLWRPSASRLRVLPVVRYEKETASDIVADLRSRFLEATGWPENDKTPRLVNGRWVQVDVRGEWPEETVGE